MPSQTPDLAKLILKASKAGDAANETEAHKATAVANLLKKQGAIG